MSSPKKILVIRNDKIGDFMLSWPAFALLKTQYPDAEITALVPQYTAALAKQCKWIDKILLDEKEDSFFKDVSTLSGKIKDGHFDQSISLFSETRTSVSLWLAGIKTRIGPATKIAQLFLNKRLRQKRSQSIKPEYEYNLDLIRFCISLNGNHEVEPPQPPFLTFDEAELKTLKSTLYDRYSIDKNKQLVCIHPGTGGSAINLSLVQYAELIKNIAAKPNVYFVITAGPGESSIAEALSHLLQNIPHHVHSSASGIIDFCKYIGICDLFISGSTGPLHIAGALNINTAAFYPARRSATSLRWQTINSASKRLSFSPEKYTGENDMLQIDIAKSADAIIKTFIS